MSGRICSGCGSELFECNCVSDSESVTAYNGEDEEETVNARIPKLILTSAAGSAAQESRRTLSREEPRPVPFAIWRNLEQESRRNRASKTLRRSLKLALRRPSADPQP